MATANCLGREINRPAGVEPRKTIVLLGRKRAWRETETVSDPPR
jgi:hypothetical protein